MLNLPRGTVYGLMGMAFTAAAGFLIQGKVIVGTALVVAGVYLICILVFQRGRRP
jgi:hypothetical protein